MLTVFTPAYNRAHTLERLYQSLRRQSVKDFVWLIVDDGSTDETKELVESWKREADFPLEYFYQENAGKSAAHNKGIELTHTELFVCVDSDDYLTEHAVEEILQTYQEIKDPEVIGILAFKGDEKGQLITHCSCQIGATGKLIDLYRDRIISGDTMLIYYSDKIKEEHFPSFPNEKFVPEAYLYDRLDEKGKLYVLPRMLYVAEYMADGYTQNMAKLIAHNPRGYLAWIEHRLKLDKRLAHKIGDVIRYVGISCVITGKKIIADSPYPMLTWLIYPAGYVFYLKRYKKYIIESEKDR